jgi:hypothetical protein
VRFGAATNAQIDASEYHGATGNFSVTLNPPAQQYQFTVRPIDRSQAVTVPLVAVDQCGDWPSLVGGGPGSF